MLPPLVVDAHEDLAFNILSMGRDYTLSATEIRRREIDAQAPFLNASGETLLGWDDYQKGRVGIIFATLFATPASFVKYDWESQFYKTFDEAHRLYWKQLDVYHQLTGEHPEKFCLVQTVTDLDAVLHSWLGNEQAPVGLVPLMEGAEGIRDPKELEEWWRRGLRIIGPAWVGTRYCGGTRQPGPLTDDGRALLDEMGEIGFILDISHMDWLAARQALDRYPRQIIASHANAAEIIPGYDGNRQLPDAIIRSLIERDGVMGVIPFCNFLELGWQADGDHQRLPIERLVEHIDHICQIAGDSKHTGLGTDFDGGFGLASVPKEIDTISDLQKLVPILSSRGYNDEDVAAIMGGNWIRVLKGSLPQ